MGKHMKLTRSEPAPRAEMSTKLHDDIEAALCDELEHLRTMRASVAKALEGEHTDITPALIRESNGISQALVKVSSEIRQREKHHAAMADRLSPEETDRLVVEYLRELPLSRRQQVRDLLDEIDEAEGVLG